MPLSPGIRLGCYEIVAPLGAGGMGEVYRARDTILKRDVALKVLPAALAHDPERMARFQREAELLASLNHPNIAILHGLVESDGQRALVMELVPGETLGARIKRGSMPLEEALNVSRQIAEALEAAHERGVVHRDLKPGNVMITPDGLVKVLDFGLAAIVQGAPATPADPFDSPTLTMNMTQAGVILGTAAYMSPEQAAGTPVDRRADIWSYGVVLWEMLSGRRLFGGDTIAHTLADVLRGPIDFEKVTAPAPIQNLLRRCLDRDVKTRLRDIGEARVTIGKYLSDPMSGTEVARQPKGRPAWIAWAVAAVFAAVAIAGWLRTRPETVGAPAPDLAFTIVPAAGSRLESVGDLGAAPEISPDGSAVIFYVDERTVQLRQLNKLTSELVRTGPLGNPGFWSPDSRSFAFSDRKSLKKMRVPDGAPESVANDAAVLVGGSWSDNGNLIFAAVGKGSSLYTVAATGGAAKRIDGLTEANLLYPEFLPGSEDFLFLSRVLAREVEEREVYLATLRDGRAADLVLLMKNATAARYTPAGGGRVLFVRNDNLYSQKLNRASRKLEGEPELVQQRVASSPSFGIADFSVSRNGSMTWRPGTAALSVVTIFDRQGKEIGTAGPPSVAQTLKLSPDETRLLVGFDSTAWLLEPGQAGQQPLKQGDRETRWSPVDGSKLLDAVPWSGENQRIVEFSVTGEGPVRELAKPPGLGRLEDISPDGKTMLFSRGALDTAVFSFRLDGTEKEPKSLVQSSETISHTRFSPDGRSIMYTVAESGIYVQPYPGPGFRKQVTSRGNYPVWRKDGREIVYLDDYQGRNYIWSVPVTGSGEEFRAGTPAPLFPARLPATRFGDLNFLAVSRDGSRFFIPQAVEQPGSDVIDVRTGSVK